MLRRWMRAEGVSRRLLAHADGERRLTNLMHLAELRHEAAAVHAAPEALQRWLQARCSGAGADDAAQLRLESDRDLVQVVTIHKSKGLEYPIVFCPLLWDGHPGRSRAGDGVEYHDASGTALIDFRVLDKADQAAVDAQLRRERDAETMRLFYVALTRAVQRCYLVVGCYQRQHGRSWSTSESCHARLNWWVAGTGMAPDDWPKHKLEPDAIDAAWAALAQRQAGVMALHALPQTAAAALAPQDPAPHSLAALAPPAHIPRGWWVGSYSSLAHGARHDGAALDHDLRVPLDAAPPTPAALDDDDILRFPRGAAAGECLHAVFERVDFGDAAHWPTLVAQVLQRFAQALPGNEARAPWDRMLVRLLQDVMHTPLPGGLRLADLPAQRRQAELEFHLSAPRLDAHALDALLRQTGQALPPLAFGTLRGYLRGFIDLVFEHGGRYFVLDWKSNHLGDTPADYAAPALQRAMQQQGYALQALLYALALHRHLQRRLGGYQHEQHFGGVLYLFVRGVRPAWRQADGSACGVHAQRPSLHTLQALSSLLHGGGAAP
jgi:exodeoxyribonuclease V beta subunit